LGFALAWKGGRIAPSIASLTVAAYTAAEVGTVVAAANADKVPELLNRAQDAANQANDGIQRVTQAGNTGDPGGLDPNDLKSIAEKAYAAARQFNYRGEYFANNPVLRKYSDEIIVHHSIPLEVLKKRPGLFTSSELNAATNLRGIPTQLNNTLHLSEIHGQLWDNFWLENPNATRAEILEFAQKLEDRFNLQNLLYEYLNITK